MAAKRLVRKRKQNITYKIRLKKIPFKLYLRGIFEIKIGGVNRSRTDLRDFADRCLTAWLSRLKTPMMIAKRFSDCKRYFSLPHDFPARAPLLPVAQHTALRRRALAFLPVGRSRIFTNSSPPMPESPPERTASRPQQPLPEKFPCRRK